MNYRYLSMLARLMAWLWTSLLRSFWTSTGAVMWMSASRLSRNYEKFCNILKFIQGCGSGSVFQLLYPDPRSKYGSGYDIQKLHTKINKKYRIIMFRRVLWIRIHFLRIRIQSLMLETNTDPDPNPDQDPIGIQGLNEQKLKKNYNWNFFYLFW